MLTVGDSRFTRGFELEALEPRVMLSADGLAGLAGGSTHSDSASGFDGLMTEEVSINSQTPALSEGFSYDPADQLAAIFEGDLNFGEESAEVAPVSQPAAAEFEAAPDAPPSPTAPVDEQATNPAQTPGSLDAPTSGDSPAPVPSDALSIADELIETLRAANGPPTPATGQAGPSPLVAKVIHADTAGFVRTQVFYLNFDGAVGVTYNGPVRVENIKVEPFQAAGELAGQEAAVISSILNALNSRFAPKR